MTISFYFAQGTLGIGQPKLDCLTALTATAKLCLTRDDTSGDLPKACKAGLEPNPAPTFKDKKIVFAVSEHWGFHSSGYNIDDSNYLTYEVLFRGQAYTVTCTRTGDGTKRHVFRPVSIIKIPGLTAQRNHAVAAAQPVGANQTANRPRTASLDEESPYNTDEPYNNVVENPYVNMRALGSQSPNPIMTTSLPAEGFARWQPSPDTLPLGRRNSL